MGVDAAVIILGITCSKLCHLGTNQNRLLKAQRLAVPIEVKHAQRRAGVYGNSTQYHHPKYCNSKRWYVLHICSFPCACIDTFCHSLTLKSTITNSHFHAKHPNVYSLPR